MNPSDRTSDARGGGSSQARSAFEYLEILRNHWLIATPVFLLVVAAVLAHALFSTPVFESYAVIQIEEQRSANDMLEAALSGGRAIIEAELEIMQSRKVAQGAVNASGAMAVVLQEHGQRPLETLLRQYDREPPVCRLRAVLPEIEVVDEDVEPLVDEDSDPEDTDGSDPDEAEDPEPVMKLVPLAPLHTRAYRLTFASDGRSFRVAPVDEEGRDGTGGSFPFDPQEEGGSEFAVDGQTLRLELREGRPDGRQFILRLRTHASAASWIEFGVYVKQVGKRTGIVHLGFACEDPLLAREVANAISLSYLRKKKQKKRERLVDQVVWLSGDIHRVNERLKKVLKRRDDYITDRNAVLLTEQARASFNTLSSLLEQRLAQEQLHYEGRIALDSLATTDDPASVLAAEGNGGGGDALMQALANRLAELEVRRGAKLRAGTKIDHPSVVALDADIAESRTRLKARVDTIREKVQAVLQRRLDAIDRRLLQIRGEIKGVREKLDELPQKETGLAEMVRDVVTYEESLAFLVRRKEEAKIAIASTGTFVHLVDEAIAPLSRSSPGLFGRALAGIFLGLCAAAALALFRNSRDQTIHTPQQLEDSLGLQLYATIPDFHTVRRRDRRQLKGSLVAHDAPNSVLAECYRTLRANLRFTDSEKRIQVLTITSALQGEGKTVTTLNLATVIAQGGNSVVVVDSDLRRPMVHQSFDGALMPGLSEILHGKIEVLEALRESSVSGLSYISAGAKTSDPGALMEGQAFADLMEFLKSRFDYVLFDVAPVLAVSDAASFFRRIDAVLLVSRAGKCPAEVVDGARRQIERLGGNLIGTILNAFDTRRGGRRRYGSYGYYGYYGETSGRDTGGAHAGSSPQATPDKMGRG